MLTGGSGGGDGGVGTLKTTQKRSVFVRAQFDYDPAKDTGLPNRGIAFKRGDILHVTNASEDEWWQARRVGNSGDQASFGIVPSKRRVERREKAKLRKVNFNNSRGGGSASSASPSLDGAVSGGGSLDRASGKKKSSLMQRLHLGHHHHQQQQQQQQQHHGHKGGSLPEDDDAAAAAAGEDLMAAADSAASGTRIPSYELVQQTKPTTVRPVILLGPFRDQLNDALVSNYPDRFASCVPHTTRPPRENEQDGRDYHFVSSRERMEQDIAGQLFVEAGQYNGNLYGTSVQSVREVAESGRHCILDVSGQAIRRLEAAGLYPMAVFVRPHSAQNIAELRSGIPEDQAAKLYEKAVKTESEFGSLCTAIVSGNTMEDLFGQVKRIIAQHADQMVWVPCKEEEL